MSLLSFAAHKAVQFYQKAAHDRFARSLQSLQKTQHDKLLSTLDYLKAVIQQSPKVLTYAEFIEHFPITTYKEHQQFFNLEKKSSVKTLPEIVRFQPTSGSTDAVKWIPYTSGLLQDFDAALGPWLFDFYSQRPEVMRGPHYWSLSWLPQDLREEGLRLDDTALFPFWKRILLKQTMAVTEAVDMTPTSEVSLFASLVYLVAQKDLSFVSVWSPTYWLNLMKLLQNHRSAIAQSLKDGRWSIFANELVHLPCPRKEDRSALLATTINPQDLWPRLTTISSWDTSTSRPFAKQIEAQWPHLQVVGKGLWATEACVTIPFRGQFVLAIESHFFEFIDSSTQQVHPSWELKIGQTVIPVVTTRGGLIRYQMQDLLRVTGFIREAPCFEFLGRADGTDMVGEKISSVRASEMLNTLSPALGASFLFAVQGGDNRYVAVIDRNSQNAALPASEDLERLLAESFHYRLARELGQLSAAEVVLREAPMERYTQLHLKRGMVLGNIKAESLRLISQKEFEENFLCN